MRQLTIRRVLGIFLIAGLSVLTSAASRAESPVSRVDTPKPYKILTSGRQITIKSIRDIKNIMVWTSSGHRVVEQKDVNANSYTFSLNINEKFFFVMIQYEGMKPFTEKIGVQ